MIWRVMEEKNGKEISVTVPDGIVSLFGVDEWIRKRAVAAQLRDGHVSIE
jgi:hypothetical protein